MTTASEELLLNGINPPGAKHTFVIPDRSEEYRRIKQLYRKHSYEEIGKRLGIPKHTVSLRIQRMVERGELKRKYLYRRPGSKCPAYSKRLCGSLPCDHCIRPSKLAAQKMTQSRKKGAT